MSLAGVLLLPRAASAEEQILSWARIDFLRNQVQLVPRNERARNARISDFLSIGDALRTARAARAELRFNDGSLARVGERATFRFTPNTRNFQLTNGTVLLLIPPGRGRSTIQTPNAVTGIQGSALFVRYIPETDTTIVGALTDNPDGPMVLFNRDGSERQALQANQIGVVENDQIIQIFEFDSELFWQTSGLAQGFDYLQGSSPTGSDALDAVRQEIREAIAKQEDFINDNRVIENPPAFSRPDSPEEEAPASEEIGEATTDSPEETDADSDREANDSPTADSTTEEKLEFEGSAAEAYLDESDPDGVNPEPVEDLADETTSENGTSSESDEGANLDETEPGEQSTDDAEDILSIGDSQDSESAANDSTTPTQIPGRIRRNGDSNGIPATEETETGTSGTEMAPASAAPVIDNSTSLELTTEGNRADSPSLPQANEPASSLGGSGNAASAVQNGGTPANVLPAPEPLPTNVTVPNLDEQEVVPLNQGVPLQPELRIVDDAPNMGMNQNVPPAPEPPPTDVTIPGLEEQEIVPPNQEIPLQPELQIVDDVPNTGTTNQ